MSNGLRFFHPDMLVFPQVEAILDLFSQLPNNYLSSPCKYCSIPDLTHSLSVFHGMALPVPSLETLLFVLLYEFVNQPQ